MKYKSLTYFKNSNNCKLNLEDCPDICRRKTTFNSVKMADKKQNDGNKEKKRKESILDLSKYLEKHIRVKFAGGREVSGKLINKIVCVYKIFKI